MKLISSVLAGALSFVLPRNTTVHIIPEVREGYEYTLCISADVEYRNIYLPEEGRRTVIMNVNDVKLTGYTGWLLVSDVEVDYEQISYHNGRTEAWIPITYQASIGAGMNEFHETAVLNISDYF